MNYNNRINQERANYEALKSCIRVKFAFFDTLTSVELVSSLQPDRLLDDKIPQEVLIEFILNKSDVGALIDEIEQTYDISLHDFDCFEIIVKSNRLIYYKKKTNLKCLIGSDPESIDVNFGTVFFLVHKSASLGLHFFDNFQSYNVR